MTAADRVALFVGGPLDSQVHRLAGNFTPPLRYESAAAGDELYRPCKATTPEGHEVWVTDRATHHHARLVADLSRRTYAEGELAAALEEAVTRLVGRLLDYGADPRTIAAGFDLDAMGLHLITATGYEP